MNSTDGLQKQLEPSERSLTTRSLHPNEEYYQKELQETDEKYQYIMYWKHGKFENVSGLAFTPIDLKKALDEAEKLLSQHKECIGFTGGRDKDAISLERIEDGRWHVEAPIFTRPQWDGYFWWAVSDTKIVLDIIGLLFEEAGWFGMLDFKVWRNEQGAEL